MALLINYTNITEAENVAEITVALDQTTGGALGITILIIVFSVLFVRIKANNPTMTALNTSIFVTMIVGLLFRLMGMLNNAVLWILIIFTGITLLANVIKPNE